MPALLIAAALLAIVAIVAARSMPGEAGGAGALELEAAAGDPDPAPAGPVAADAVDLAGPVPVAVFDGGADLLAAVGGAVKKLFQLPANAAPYADAIARAEAAHGIPETLLARQLHEESRYRPEVIDGRVKSSAGAIGIAQFMPATARDFNLDPTDPFASIDAAARYMAQLYKITGDWAKALASYNWGVGNVTRRGLDRAPDETRKYVAAILADVEV